VAIDAASARATRSASAFVPDGSRFPAVVSVTALRDAQGGIIGNFNSIRFSDSY
jgi:hypothetical protein